MLSASAAPSCIVWLSVSQAKEELLAQAAVDTVLYLSRGCFCILVISPVCALLDYSTPFICVRSVVDVTEL